MFFCIKITEIYRRNKYENLLFVIKKIIFATDPASPEGMARSIFIGNGRLRTFSSAFKLRNFETISEETTTRRPRG
jgi:hypothetical protein